ncbi:MAG: 3-dehydroquinate synthase [Phycisphaerales bacterium]|nr:3-dehydroquinate synthase [Phycisphaerales bacterium]
MNQRTVRVQASSKSYDVIVGSGLLASLGGLVRPVVSNARKALLIHDARLPTALVESCGRSLTAAGCVPVLQAFEASESNKVLAQAEFLHTRAAAARLDRHDLVVALGGGIVGDVAGFVGATFKRGLRVIQCPTTLLAMVDASVGGKTGVNLRHEGVLLKNYVGTFHQPELVVASVDALQTLPVREFRAGLAECIKHAMISADWGDPGLWDWTSHAIGAILKRAPNALVELVARNVAVKAAVVGSDERELDESGGRALLNLGHTFAHAIETLPGISPDGDPVHAPLLHGEAVALGLQAACATAVALGLFEIAEAVRVRNLLEEAGLPIGVRRLPPGERVLERMASDKKSIAGAMRLVLPTGRGRASVVQSPEPTAVIRGIASISVP